MDEPIDEPVFRHDQPLRELTTLAVGGPARHVARCANASELGRALDFADAQGLPVVILGGGSNVIVSDRGFDGMVVQLTDDRLQIDQETGRVEVGAGYDWDDLVARTVGSGLSGLECLSGIPGWAGAAPVQNIGAYGRELSDTLRAVDVFDLGSGRNLRLDAETCGFGYRESRFKGEWRGRYWVTGLHLQLHPGGDPVVAYPELAERMGASGSEATAATVRDIVLEIRRSKSMVLDPHDPNRRSAGSFFTNPIVDPRTAENVAAKVGEDANLPRWQLADGRVKLAAAWLIQRAGFEKGHRHGRAGLSTAHVLALVNRGEASTSELTELARLIRDRVQDTFGIRLRPEPVPLGFTDEEKDDLWG